jgi:Tle cognate immunity protein 4 C-terminal domain
MLGAGGCNQQYAPGASVSSQLANSPFTTHGIGRFLIDLPEHFHLLPNSSIELTFGKTIGFTKVNALAIRTSGNTPTFSSVVANRINELRSSYHQDSESKSKFISLQRLGGDVGSPVVVRSFYGGLTDVFVCEVFVEGGETVTLLSRRASTQPGRGGPDVVESQLIEIAAGLRGVDPATANAPGICLGKALFNSAHDGEYVSISFRSTLWPECLFRVTSRSMLNELDGGLLKRVDSNAAQLATMGFRSNVLRRGATTLGGAPAEEILETGKDRDKTVRTFMSEVVLKTPATFAKPLLTLVCNMGGQVGPEYVEPTLSDKDSVALWDAVRASVRPRVGAV